MYFQKNPEFLKGRGGVHDYGILRAWGVTHFGISEGKGGLKHGSRPWLGMDIFWNCPMHPASERYSTHVICFSQEDNSFKHGEYTFHHTLDFIRTIKFTESYHDIERHCAVYLFNRHVASILKIYTCTYTVYMERKVGIQ